MSAPVKLTKQQALALRRLSTFEGPVLASKVRCNVVWYAGDVMERLAKRGLVQFTGRGMAAVYWITDEGRAALAKIAQEG